MLAPRNDTAGNRRPLPVLQEVRPRDGFRLPPLARAKGQVEAELLAF